MIRSFVLLALLPLLAAAVWFGLRAYDVYSSLTTMTGRSVARIHGEPTVVIPPLNGDQRINVLVLGSDNDKKREEARPLTQSIIVVTIDPKHDKVAMLSIPRDFWLPIAGHGMGKIDTASKYGGIALTRQTLESAFHIPIDYYAWVGLNGFVRVIDTFGGVTLDASYPVLDDRYPADLGSNFPYAYRRVFIPPGWQHMSGSYALEYVRSRHGDLIGDFGRSARQQQILVQLQQKITAMNLLMRLPDVMRDLKDSVRTDFGLSQLLPLYQLSHHIQRRDVTQIVLQAPTYSTYATSTDGQSILEPNWAKIRPLVSHMFGPLVGKSSKPGPKSAQPSATPSKTVATAEPTSTPGPATSPTSVSAAQRIDRLPGKLLYVDRGNLFELLPNKKTRQLTWSGDGAMPAPSPDGRSIAFVRFTKGLERYDKFASDVWVLDPRTGRQHVLTHDEASNPPNNLWAAWPTWSSNGQRIVFSSDRAKLAYAPSDIRSVALALHEVNLNGVEQGQMTTPQTNSGGDTEATWRPRHSQVVYVRWSYNAVTFQPYSQLVLEDLSSARTTYLTAPGARVVDPAWDPSGTHVAFIRGSGVGDQIVEAQLQFGSSGPRLGARKVIARGEVAQPAFTPDGQWLSYLRANGDSFNLYLTSLRTGRSAKVDEVPGDLDARWRPVWTR